jgi:hypothetical protein
MSKKYSLENFSAGHFFEELESEESFYCRKFFGGLSIYVFGKMVAFLSEHPGDKEWRGKKFKTEIWNGCLIPSHREYHDSLIGKIKGTSVHPVITKWLYLPASSPHFEASMFLLIEMIEKKNEEIGIEPEVKSNRKKTGRVRK